MTNRSKISGGIGRRLLYKQGERIFSEGQPGKEMYVVESGRIKIFLTAQDRELTLAILKKGDFFGEMALLEDLPRSASAAAVETTRLIAIGKGDFKFLIQEHPEIAMKVLGRFSTRLRDADNLINLLLLGDVTGCVIHELVKQVVVIYGSEDNIPKECVIPLSMQQLSESTGLDIEPIEQVMSELKRSGLASVEDDGIVLRKHRKLKSYLDYFNWRERGQYQPKNAE